MNTTITAQHAAERQTWFHVRSVNLRELLLLCEVFESHKIIVSFLSLSTRAKPSIKLARRPQATENKGISARLENLSEQAKTSLEVQMTPTESEMKICGRPLAGTSHCFESETKIIKQR